MEREQVKGAETERNNTERKTFSFSFSLSLSLSLSLFLAFSFSFSLSLSFHRQRQRQRQHQSGRCLYYLRTTRRYRIMQMKYCMQCGGKLSHTAYLGRLAPIYLSFCSSTTLKHKSASTALLAASADLNKKASHGDS